MSRSAHRWKLDSPEKLAEAGYRRCSTTNCPLCARTVVIYMREHEFPVFLNSKTFFPHLVLNDEKTAIEHASSDLPPWQRPKPDLKSRAAGDRE